MRQFKYGTIGTNLPSHSRAQLLPQSSWSWTSCCRNTTSFLILTFLSLFYSLCLLSCMPCIITTQVHGNTAANRQDCISVRVLKFKEGEVIFVDLPFPSHSLAWNLLCSCSAVEQIWLSTIGCFSPSMGRWVCWRALQSSCDLDESCLELQICSPVWCTINSTTANVLKLLCWDGFRTKECFLHCHVA